MLAAPGMRSDGRCTSCHARIRWAILDGTARLMPLDTEPHPDGNVHVVDWGPRTRALTRPIVAVNAAERAITPYAYVTHFATCPNAAEHRTGDRITGGHR